MMKSLLARATSLVLVALSVVLTPSVFARRGSETPPSVPARGAEMPWTTYEAEAMQTTGTVLGPKYEPFLVETEASAQQAVKLSAGDYVEFTAKAPANALVVRYSLPDAPRGGGLEAVVEVSVNGRAVRTLSLTSRYMHLYGAYPFANDPTQGKPRNFHDEAQVRELTIAAGDVVRLQFGGGLKHRPSLEPASYGIIDLVDLEQVAPPLPAPANALSVRAFGAKGDGHADDTSAFRACIAASLEQKRTAWIPAGDYKLTGDLVLTSGVNLQGAGMWHTRLVGDAELYGQADRRVRLKLAGTGISIADFAIMGRLNYRNDQEPNDGVVGAGISDSSIERIWVEHTKAGAWIYNGTRLQITGCRFRNLLADGVNLCVGTSESLIENCTARGTGDDCFAIWPAPSDQGFDQVRRPGRNVIRRCTGQLTFLANGGALYGGDSNRIEDCLFTDIATGCGILVSTTFPTTDEATGIDNNFSGQTVVRNVELLRCGGYDHSWAWRGSVQLCMDRRSLSGVRLQDVAIRDSLSEGITVVAPGRARNQGTLSDTRLANVVVSGAGKSGHSRGDLWVREDAAGGLALDNSAIPTVRNDSKAFTVTGAP